MIMDMLKNLLSLKVLTSKQEFCDKCKIRFAYYHNVVKLLLRFSQNSCFEVNTFWLEMSLSVSLIPPKPDSTKSKLVYLAKITLTNGLTDLSFLLIYKFSYLDFKPFRVFDNILLWNSQTWRWIWPQNFSICLEITTIERLGSINC